MKAEPLFPTLTPSVRSTCSPPRFTAGWPSNPSHPSKPPGRCAATCTSHSPQTELRQGQPFGAGRRFPRASSSKVSTSATEIPSSTSRPRCAGGVGPRSTTDVMPGVMSRARASRSRSLDLEPQAAGGMSRARSTSPTPEAIPASESIPTTQVTGTATARAASSHDDARTARVCRGAVAHKTSVAGSFDRVMHVPPASDRRGLITALASYRRPGHRHSSGPRFRSAVGWRGKIGRVG